MAVDCWSNTHRNGCGDAADGGIPGVFSRLLLCLKRVAENQVHGSLRVGGGMNDEAVNPYRAWVELAKCLTCKLQSACSCGLASQAGMRTVI